MHEKEEEEEAGLLCNSERQTYVGKEFHEEKNRDRGPRFMKSNDNACRASYIVVRAGVCSAECTRRLCTCTEDIRRK